MHVCVHACVQMSWLQMTQHCLWHIQTEFNKCSGLQLLLPSLTVTPPPPPPLNECVKQMGLRSTPKNTFSLTWLRHTYLLWSHSATDSHTFVHIWAPSPFCFSTDPWWEPAPKDRFQQQQKRLEKGWKKNSNLRNTEITQLWLTQNEAETQHPLKRMHPLTQSLANHLCCPWNFSPRRKHVLCELFPKLLFSPSMPVDAMLIYIRVLWQATK